MKHSIIVIIIIIVLALFVLPLIYISLGKIKSPFESFSVGKNSILASQNYIPVPAGDADQSKLNKVENIFDLDLEKKCSASGTPMLPSDVTTIFNIKEKTASLTSDAFKLVWNLRGEFDKTKPYGRTSSPNSVLFGGGDKPETSLVISIWAGKYNNAECVAYHKKMFGYYHDTGRFLKEYDWDKNGFSLIEKGLSNIAGHSYYWYLFEDLRSRGGSLTDSETGGSLLTEKNTSNQVFTAIYDTYNNGIKYRVTFTGDREHNKSYRSVISAANAYLGSLYLK